MHQQENQVEEMHLKHFNFIHLIFFIMAEQSGIIRLKGTIGGISFYKSGDGYLAREKDKNSFIRCGPQFQIFSVYKILQIAP